MKSIKLKSTDKVVMYMYQTEYEVPLEDIQQCLSAGFTFIPTLRKATGTVFEKLPSKVDSNDYII